MGLGEAVRVAGIGCRKGVSAEEVLAAVSAGGGADVMAVVRARAGEPGVVEAAARFGVPLRVAEAVEDGRLLSWSAASVAAAGVGSASEAAALAVAGPEGRLLGPRLVVGRVTCAIAVTGDVL